MVIKFFGAAHEVTGSCHYVEAGGKKLLVDCGLQQGSDEKDGQQLPFNAAEIDYLLLTHAHIDHSGRLPMLLKYGFRGKIIATEATSDLSAIMLRDSAHIQELDAEWCNRKGKRAGKDACEPLYTVADAENVLKLFSPQPYKTLIPLDDTFSIRFTDAGHLLGSASIELFITENGVKKTVVFSGDIGNTNRPLLNDPQTIAETDYIVMESTYGDRNHTREADYITEFAHIIEATLGKGGNVVIPSFAVGRTQELLYFIREIKARKLVKFDFPVYVDSPLATAATKVYKDDYADTYDSEAMALVKQGVNPLQFDNLHTIESSDESKALNFDKAPKVIISSSGMCEAGRIRHHLKHNLWRPECAVVFVGYQANGTLGRLLLDGVKSVRLFQEEIAVNAKIYKFEGLSAHADRQGLLNWLSAFTKKPGKVFVIHGESGTSDAFAKVIEDTFHIPAVAPNYLAAFDLADGRVLSEGVVSIVQEKVRPAVFARSAVYGRLLAAGERLMRLIKKREHGANKDLAKFADQINQLADKWEK